MEAQEVRFNQIIERLGENKEFGFTFGFPINTNWDMVQEALDNIKMACKEFEAKQKAMVAPEEPNPEAGDVTQ